MGTMCVPSAHKEQLKDSHKLSSLNTMIQKGIVQYNQIEVSLELHRPILFQYSTGMQQSQAVPLYLAKDSLALRQSFL
jgi:hypothetical protein